MLIAACSGPTPRPRLPILFVSDRDGSVRIYEETDDGAVLPIGDAVGGVHSDTMPARLPDGSVVFVSDRDGNPEIYLASTRSEVRRLTTDPPGSPAMDSAPAPFGKDRIVFARTEPGAPPGSPRDLYTLRLDGGGPVRLTRNPADDSEPWGSRDGRSVLFVSSRSGEARIHLIPDAGAEDPDAAAICLSDFDPSQVSPPGGGGAYSDHGPVYVQDGAIVFSRSRADGVGQIFMMDGRGARAGLRQVTDLLVLPFGATEPMPLDERTILLSAGPSPDRRTSGGSGRYAVYSIALGGFNLARVTRNRAPYSDYTRRLMIH